MPNVAGVHLSIVIPAFNEELRLPRTLHEVMEYLSSQPYSSEILVVNDGSTDRTESMVKGWPLSAVPVRLVNHPDRANHGKGAAVRLGMLKSRGEFRLFMDADNSTTVDQVERFWPFFGQGCDVVIGSRNMEGSVVAVHQPRYKELAGRFGNWIIRVLAVPGIADTQAGFKIFNRRSAELIFPRITIDRWGYDIEILVIAHLLGLKVREIPITWVNAPGSKVSLRSYVDVLGEVWRIRRNARSGMYEDRGQVSEARGQAPTPK